VIVVKEGVMKASHICKILIIVIISLLLTTAPVTPVGAERTSKSLNPIELRLGTYFSTKDVRYGQAEHFVKLASERTDGRLKIVLYPAQQLAKATEAIDAVASGAVDAYLPMTPHVSGVWPLFDLPCQDVFYSDYNTAHKALNEIVAPLDEYFKKDGIKIPFAFSSSVANFFSINRNLMGVAGFKGLKLAGIGGIKSKVFTGFGASVVDIAAPERYSALQRKITDSTFTTTSTFWGTRLYEVAPFIDRIDAVAIAMFLAVNLKKWENLPKDIQNVITELGVEYQNYAAKTNADLDSVVYEQAKGKGCTVYVWPDSERAKVRKATFALVEKELMKYGALGQQMLEIVKKYAQ
jgi:TRAP-type C4-dicarboxylate transport system substrate-binding protein